MRFLTPIVALLVLALPVMGQQPPSKNCECSTTGVCACVNCGCLFCSDDESAPLVDPHGLIALLGGKVDSDPNGLHALEAALANVKSKVGPNYAFMHTFATAAKQSLVVGFNCKAPEGEKWLTAYTDGSDGWFKEADSGKILVTAFENGKLMVKTRLPGNATASQIQAALQEPQPQQQFQQQPVYMMMGGGGMGGGGCAGGSCGGGGFGGMMGGGGCSGGRCR